MSKGPKEWDKKLNDLEIEVLHILASEELGYKEIAKRLFVSLRTVNNRIESAKQKYGTTSTRKLIYLAARDRLI